MIKFYDEMPIDENFEKWWRENGVITNPKILGEAFKELSRNAWEACWELLHKVKPQEEVLDKDV